MASADEDTFTAASCLERFREEYDKKITPSSLSQEFIGLVKTIILQECDKVSSAGYITLSPQGVKRGNGGKVELPPWYRMYVEPGFEFRFASKEMFQDVTWYFRLRGFTVTGMVNSIKISWIG